VTRTTRHAAAACLSVLLSWAGVAHAFDIELAAPESRAGVVSVDARLSDVFPDPVARSLSRGMPATLHFHVELWRKRTAWFDRLEGSFDASVRIRYEVWNDWYRIERSGGASRTLTSLDSVQALLERPIELPAGRRSKMQEGTRYFVTVSATLAPLSVEDVQEVEGWLSGEVENKRHSGFGVFTELPHSLYDAVRNFAGFGDRHARAQTPVFDPAEFSAPR
jgi:hypothetical protein